VQHHEIERVFQVHFFLHDKHTLASTDSAGLIVTTDNRLLYAQHGTVQTRKRMLAWAVHVINFLSSPSVKLAFQEPSAARQKARQRSGQEPLPGWSAIQWQHQIRDYTKEKLRAKKCTHRFRYRVRGYFKHFTRGRLMGGSSGHLIMFVGARLRFSNLRDRVSHAKAERDSRVPAEAVYLLWPAHAPQASTQWTVGKPS
jgi:hypothetical protein